MAVGCKQPVIVVTLKMSVRQAMSSIGVCFLVSKQANV
jgi:hypothetical protein